MLGSGIMLMFIVPLAMTFKWWMKLSHGNLFSNACTIQSKLLIVLRVNAAETCLGKWHIIPLLLINVIDAYTVIWCQRPGSITSPLMGLFQFPGAAFLRAAGDALGEGDREVLIPLRWYPTHFVLSSPTHTWSHCLSSQDWKNGGDDDRSQGYAARKFIKCGDLAESLWYMLGWIQPAFSYILT